MAVHPGAFANRDPMKDITQDEISKLTRAMKDERFRSHIDEYTREISDPAHRKEYLEYLDQLEAKGEMPEGQQLLRCQPGLCVKTAILFKNGQTQKLFVNIVHSDRLDDLSMTPAEKGGGQQVHLPYSLSPPRPDRDNKDEYCMTCDFAVSSGTFLRAAQSSQILKLLVDTAADGMAQQFFKGHEEVKKDFKLMQRMACKGSAPMPMSVRAELLKDKGTKATAPKITGRDAVTPSELREMRAAAKVRTKLSGIPAAEDDEAVKEVSSKTTEEAPSGRIRVPPHKLIHSGILDLTDYMESSGRAQHTTTTIPKLLKLVVELPTVKKSSDIVMEVTKDNVVVEVDGKFYLDLPLPYEIEDDKGSAKFDKAKQTLTLELPVVPKAPDPALLALARPPVPDDEDVEAEPAAAEEPPAATEPPTPATDEPVEVVAADGKPTDTEADSPEQQHQRLEVKFKASREDVEDFTQKEILVTEVVEPQTSQETTEATRLVEEVDEQPVDIITSKSLSSFAQQQLDLSTTLDFRICPSKSDVSEGETIHSVGWRLGRQNLILRIRFQSDQLDVADLRICLVARRLAVSVCTRRTSTERWGRHCIRRTLFGAIDPRQWHAELIRDPQDESLELLLVLRKAVRGEHWETGFLDDSTLDLSEAEKVSLGLMEPPKESDALTDELQQPPKQEAVLVEDSAELDIDAPVIHTTATSKLQLSAEVSAAVVQSATVMGQSVILRNRLMYQLL